MLSDVTKTPRLIGSESGATRSVAAGVCRPPSPVSCFPQSDCADNTSPLSNAQHGVFFRALLLLTLSLHNPMKQVLFLSFFKFLQIRKREVT